jgi:hypothetical protein
VHVSDRFPLNSLRLRRAVPAAGTALMDRSDRDGGRSRGFSQSRKSRAERRSRSRRPARLTRPRVRTRRSLRRGPALGGWILKTSVVFSEKPPFFVAEGSLRQRPSVRLMQ